MKLRFFKEGVQFGCRKFHIPMGNLFCHTNVDVDFDPSDGKSRIIYATYYLFETPLGSVRFEFIPVVS